MRCERCGVQPFAGAPCRCDELALDVELRAAIARRVAAALERLPERARGARRSRLATLSGVPTPICERPDCGHKAEWWVWAPGYPRHALCAGCLEPVVDRLSETNAPTLGKLQLEPIDPHSRRRAVVHFGN